MGINGLSGNMNPYMNYRMKDIPTVTEKEVKQQELNTQNHQNLKTDKDNTVKQTEQAAISQRKIASANLEDISLTFNKEESFDYIGNDSKIENLDMQKAISDMKKDEVLQGYQYFVGSGVNANNSADGVVFQKLGLV